MNIFDYANEEPESCRPRTSVNGPKAAFETQESFTV